MLKQSIWSEDNGVIKRFAHLLWQLKQEVAPPWSPRGGGSVESCGSAGRHCSPGWAGLEMLIIKFCIRVLFLEKA